MNEYLLGLIQKYKARGVLTDTNILILYIIDSFDPNLIGTSKATSQFTQDDFLRAAKFIDYFDVKVTTPHVLTEASNLLKDRAGLHIALRKYVELSKKSILTVNIFPKQKHFRDLVWLIQRLMKQQRVYTWLLQTTVSYSAIWKAKKPM